jgi:DNA-directed RNA polymerase subunit RPC12/RpoP
MTEHDKEKSVYLCEDCDKQFKDNYNKWSHWLRCKCGGKAYRVDRVKRSYPMTKF